MVKWGYNMEYKAEDVIKFNNGEYLVVDVINDKNNTYLYLINNDEYLNDVSITKVINNNGVVEYRFIEDDEEFNYVLNKLFLNSKDEIIDFLVDED